MRQLNKLIPILMMSVLLSQCASPPSHAPTVPAHAPKPSVTTAPKIDPWQQHRQAVAQQTHWQAIGRIAVTHGHEGGNASFNWQQTAQDFEMTLTGALGLGSARLSGNHQQVTLIDHEGNIFKADNPEALMETLVGWQVPLTGLAYWVRGIPVPNTKTHAMVTDPQGRLTFLKQKGWDIKYSHYHAAPVRPKKIVLLNEKLKIKLVIKEWHT